MSAVEGGESLFFIDKGCSAEPEKPESKDSSQDNQQKTQITEPQSHAKSKRKSARKRDHKGRPTYNSALDNDDSKKLLQTDADLENIVFGDLSSNILSSDAPAPKKEGNLLPFTISTDPHEDDSSDEESSGMHIIATKKPVWEDDDDKSLSFKLLENKRLRKLRETEEENEISGGKYEKRLRSQFEKLVGNPKWAELKKEENQEQEDNVNLTATNFLGRSLHLPASVIDIQQLRDVNVGKKYSSALTCTEFHPSSKIVLTSASGNTFELYQVNKRSNQKIQSVYLEKFPIRCAHFASHGEEVVVSSFRKYYYVYNMAGGKVTTVQGIRGIFGADLFSIARGGELLAELWPFRVKGHKENSLENFVVSPDSAYLAFRGSNGYIHLVSGKTKQWIHSFKMNTQVKNIAFVPNTTKLLSSGGGGEVYLWDVRSRRCLHKFQDEGCIKSTSLAISPNGQFFACGSSSGVVNVYDDHCLHEKNPSPLKTVMNLTTAVNELAFNVTSEILALSSEVMKNKMKLLHTPTMNVFQNWPSPRTKLGHVVSMDFSSESGYLTTGNSKGFANLYRLHHFPDA